MIHISRVVGYNEQSQLLMAPHQSVQKWLTLTAHCLATFSNAIGFGLFFTNTDVFASYYDVLPSDMSNTYFLGLIFQLIFCIPAMKLIEWRLDYSLICGAFLSTASYYVQYIAQQNFFVVVCCMSLEAFGQAILLPMSAYLAQRWFPLHQRSFAIALSFYSNLLGFAFGAIFTTLYVKAPVHILRELLIVAMISTFCLVVSVILVKNKPKVLLERYKTISIRQIRELWKYKYNTYLIIMSSVFLGLSWTYLSEMSYLLTLFTPVQLGILMIVWIVCGSLFGIIMSSLSNRWVSRNGNNLFYDRAAKMTLLLGFIGYILMGFSYQYNFSSFVGHVFLTIFIGIGSIGYYGLMMMSIIQTFYPLSSLLIGNLLSVGASLYSALASGLNKFTDYNTYFILAAIGFLPLVYLALTYETNFKRYRYYLDEKKLQYVLLKIEDTKSHFNDRKYQ